MPHITARFVSGGTLEGTQNLEGFIRGQKFNIRVAIAQALEYPPQEVAFYSSREDPELTDNAFPLEIVIDSGIRTLDREEEVVKRAKELLLEKCPDIETYHFGIWLKTHEKNEFVEYKPS